MQYNSITWTKTNSNCKFDPTKYSPNLTLLTLIEPRTVNTKH